MTFGTAVLLLQVLMLGFPPPSHVPSPWSSTQAALVQSFGASGNCGVGSGRGVDRAPAGKPEPVCVSWSKALSHSSPRYSHQCPEGLNTVFGPSWAVSDKPSGSRSRERLVGPEGTEYS